MNPMNATIRTDCPVCREPLSLETRLAGQTVRCPNCSEVFHAAEYRRFASNDDKRLSAALPVSSEDESAEAHSKETMAGTGTSGTVAMPNQTGLRRLGRFELKRLLGQGEFGRVYLAFDPELEREVALKVLTFGSGQRKRVQRFLTEAKAAARLRHPNIVPTFESGQADGRYYIASEYIEGETLSKEMKRQQFSPAQAAGIVYKLADALSHSHENDVVHRDVKPQNILIDQRGEPHLMDFGLAKRVDDDSTVTTDGSVLGTPAYMSPEQARGEFSLVGPASDQYSLAVVLFQLLTGSTPFQGPPHLVIASVARGRVPPLSTVRSDLPRDLTAVCDQALQLDPEKRYSTCREFASDLQNWLERRPVRARPRSHIQRLLRRLAEHKLVVGITAIMFTLVCLLMLSITQVWRESKDSQPEAITAQTAEATDIPTSEKKSHFSNSRTSTVVDDGFTALLGESDEWEWGPHEPIAELEIPGKRFRTPALSRDGLLLIVAAGSRTDLQDFDLYFSRRLTVESKWPPLQLMPGPVNSDALDSSPSISADGLTVYFATDRLRTRGFMNTGSLMSCRWDESQQQWAGVETISISEHKYHSDQPLISPDDSECLFSNNFPDGKWTVWQAGRPDNRSPFGGLISLRSTQDALRNLDVRDAVCFADNGLGVVLLLHETPYRFLGCTRRIHGAQWDSPRLIAAIPDDCYDFTYSPESKTIILDAGYQGTPVLRQMRLQKRKSEMSLEEDSAGGLFSISGNRRYVKSKVQQFIRETGILPSMAQDHKSVARLHVNLAGLQFGEQELISVEALTGRSPVFPDRTLLVDDEAEHAGVVFVIVRSEKYRIPDTKTLIELGFYREQVCKVSSERLDAIPEKQQVSSASAFQAILRGEKPSASSDVK